jgi:hypothetical protein
VTSVNCETCGKPLIREGGDPWKTMVGYIGRSLPPGHNHDDNCVAHTYYCEDGHLNKLSPINRCPACDWRGKNTCTVPGCGRKVDALPQEAKRG